MNQYTNINYEGEDVMVQISKRFKHTQQGLVDDIASSIGTYLKRTSYHDININAC